MKRSTSDPSRSPPTASLLPVADTPQSTTPEPERLTEGLRDGTVQALRYEALLADDFLLLGQLLAERTDLPFHLHMDADMPAELLRTLLDALPEDRPVPAIVLSGTLPDQVPDEALAQLFTHPTLRSLSLTELLLRSEQVQAIVDAVRQTPSPLTSLTYCDDVECVLDPAIRALITALPQLRTLELGATSLGSGSVEADDPDALALARCLLNLPLDALTLKDFGALMTHLLQMWSPQEPPQWQQLAVSLIGMTVFDDREVGHMATFLHGCVSTPSIQTLRLQQFYVDDGDPENRGKNHLPFCPAAYRLVALLADALVRRQAPLQLEMDSGDIGALELLLTSLSGRPGIRCVHALHLAFRPTPAGLASGCSGHDPAGRFLLAAATVTGALSRLDSLCITLDPAVDPDLPGSQAVEDPEASDDPSGSDASEASSGPDTEPAPPPLPPLPVSALMPLAQTLASTHLTSLTFAGRWLAPLPEVLQPCLARVAARAVHAALQIQALDLGLGFLQPPMALPTEVGLIVAQHIQPDGPGRPLVAQLPALDRSTLLHFVDRYNRLATTAGAAPHPLTGLAMDIRQRMLPGQTLDQPGTAVDFR